MDGIINIYKEKGYTSHDVVAIVRKTLDYSKVGHTGTLDPQAEGVLPVCVGKATKISEYLMSETKRYTAEVTLGITTSTEDNTGEIIEVKPVNFDKEAIKEAVNPFKGEYLQIPPMYSAIKINGEKLYNLARQGKIVKREPKNITIHDIDILKFLPPDKIMIDVVCSKGTYIRTLCADIGQKLGCGANMSSLTRTQSGKFVLEDSIKLDTLKQYKQEQKLDQILIKIETIFCEFSKVHIKADFEKALYNGNILYSQSIEKTSTPLKPNQDILVYDCRQTLIGIYKVFDDAENKLFMKPIKILI